MNCTMKKNSKYKIIFTLGNQDDEESILTGQRGDVLILDNKGNYYDPYFITLKRIEGEFLKKNTCYLGDKLVILHQVTRENIIKSILELHNWLFQERWKPLTEESLEKFYFPSEDWVFYEVEI